MDECAENADARVIVDAFKVLDSARDPEAREATQVSDVAIFVTVGTATTALTALEIATKEVRKLVSPLAAKATLQAAVSVMSCSVLLPTIIPEKQKKNREEERAFGRHSWTKC